MENSSSKLFTEAARTVGRVAYLPHVREAWPLMRAAHMDLQLMRIPRVNLLLIGPDRIVENALDILLPTARTPIGTWRAGEPLALPPTTDVGTMILRGVDTLTIDDQRRLSVWLEVTAGRTQVVSTASRRLLTRVQAAEFLDTLYYRLNTVCVDVTA